MLVNDTMAEFNGEISLFDGFFNPIARATIMWDLSYVHVYLGNLPLAHGLITLDQVVLTMDARESFILEFDMMVTVLFLAEFESSFTVTKHGDNFDLQFLTPIDIALLGSSSIEVNANLNTADVSLSSFGVDLNVANGFFTLSGQFTGTDGLIEGEFELPMLGCHGNVQMRTNSTAASFASTLSLFKGALSADVSAQLRWDLSYFEGSLSKLEISGLISVDDVILVISAKDKLTRFSGRLSIPLLGCNSQLSIDVDDEKAEIDSEIELFGGFVYAHATVQWRWDGSHASATLHELTLGILHIRQATV